MPVEGILQKDIKTNRVVMVLREKEDSMTDEEYNSALEQGLARHREDYEKNLEDKKKKT